VTAELFAEHVEANLLAFFRGLRRLGLRTGPDDVALALRALAVVGFDSAAQAEAAVAAVVVRQPDEVALFHEAFAQFLLRLRRQDAHAWVAQQTLSANVARLRQARHRHPQIIWMGADAHRPPVDDRQSEADEDVQLHAGASRQEALRVADFATLTEAEQQEVTQLQQHVRRLWKTTRRWRGPAEKGPVDVAATVRRAARCGEWLPLAHHERQRVERPVVMVCDVSGSMDPYSRMLLRFAHGLLRVGLPLEVFLFSTKLTRATQFLRQHNPDRALAEVGARTPDFAGGTCLADALVEFRRDWARHVLRGDPLLLVATDGFDSGDPLLLNAELARLAYLARRVVWLNPAAGDARYQPEAQAARVLMARCDDVYAAHSWAALEAAWAGIAASHQHRPA